MLLTHFSESVRMALKDSINHLVSHFSVEEIYEYVCMYLYEFGGKVI